MLLTHVHTYTRARARTRTHTHTHTHKRCESDHAISTAWVMLMPTVV